jgi:hypothetical protein
MSDDKQGILDVKVKTASGERVDIEIQVVNHGDYGSAFVLPCADVTEQLGEREDYRNLQRSICVLITVACKSTRTGSHNFYRLHPETNSGLKPRP